MQIWRFSRIRITKIWIKRNGIRRIRFRRIGIRRIRFRRIRIRRRNIRRIRIQEENYETKRIGALIADIKILLMLWLRIRRVLECDLEIFPFIAKETSPGTWYENHPKLNTSEKSQPISTNEGSNESLSLQVRKSRILFQKKYSCDNSLLTF